MCNRCRQRVLTSINNRDVLHTCSSGDSTLDNQDVPLTGKFEDYTGSGQKTGYNIMYQGLPNTEFGTDSWLEGAEDDDRTDRGAISDTHRTRPFIDFVDFRNISKR